MGEKEFVCRDGVTHHGDFGYHSMESVTALLNTQSAEIAGLRETVESLKKDVPYLLGEARWDLIVQGAETGYPASHKARCQRVVKALGVEVPDTRTRKPGVPGREQMYKILKERSEEIQRGEVNDAAKGE